MGGFQSTMMHANSKFNIEHNRVGRYFVSDSNNYLDAQFVQNNFEDV